MIARDIILIVESILGKEQFSNNDPPATMSCEFKLAIANQKMDETLQILRFFCPILTPSSRDSVTLGKAVALGRRSSGLSELAHPHC